MNNFGFSQQMKIKLFGISESNCTPSEYPNSSFKLSKDSISFLSECGKTIAHYKWSDISFSEDESSFSVLEAQKKNKLLEVSGSSERLSHLKERIHLHEAESHHSDSFKPDFFSVPLKLRRVHFYLFVWMTLFILVESYAYISKNGVPVSYVISSVVQSHHARFSPLALRFRILFNRYLPLDCLPRRPHSQRSYLRICFEF